MIVGTYKVIAHMSGALLGAFSYSDMQGSKWIAAKAARHRAVLIRNKDGTNCRIIHELTERRAVKDIIKAKPYGIGARVEIPVHFDAWMRGACVGTVRGYRHGSAGTSDVMLVRMDDTGIKKLVRVPRLDWEYMKPAR